jgi:hypothetical protein
MTAFWFGFSFTMGAIAALGLLALTAEVVDRVWRRQAASTAAAPSRRRGPPWRHRPEDSTEMHDGQCPRPPRNPPPPETRDGP